MEIPRHTFSNLSGIEGLVHGFFTRHGGVSRAPCDSLNAAWNVGDSREAVSENLLRIRNALGLERLVASPQVHGDTIHVIDEETLANAEAMHPASILPPGDALVTNLRGVGLLVKVADCQAIFLVDPVRKVVANIHSGWRGSVHDLAVKVIRLLEERFGSRPEDLLACVGPSLGPCCAEFVNYRDELPPSFWGHETEKSRHFDFWAITTRQLTEAGVRPESIEVAGRCTVCEKHDFFSYRGERVTGRLAAVLGWT